MIKSMQNMPVSGDDSKSWQSVGKEEFERAQGIQENRIGCK